MGNFQFPKDWTTGKDKIYFITDDGVEITNTMLDNYGSLYDKAGAGAVSEAGIDVENYGFS